MQELVEEVKDINNQIAYVKQEMLNKSKKLRDSAGLHVATAYLKSVAERLEEFLEETKVDSLKEIKNQIHKLQLMLAEEAAKRAKAEKLDIAEACLNGSMEALQEFIERHESHTLVVLGEA